jgi:DNA-binding winged helix-turn-helix (wHTH) protein
VVTRQALFDALWPEHFVSDDALERLVVLARRAVGDSGRTQRVIKTVRGRGYRFVAPVEEHPPAPSGDALLQPSHVHLKLRQLLLCRSLWTLNAGRSPSCPVLSRLL